MTFAFIAEYFDCQAGFCMKPNPHLGFQVDGDNLEPHNVDYYSNNQFYESPHHRQGLKDCSRHEQSATAALFI
jgi:hypothetical protein